MNTPPTAPLQNFDKRYPNASERIVVAQLRKKLRGATIYCAITAPFFLLTAVPFLMCLLLAMFGLDQHDLLGALIGAVIYGIYGIFFGSLSVATGAVFGIGFFRYLDIRKRLRQMNNLFFPDY